MSGHPEQTEEKIVGRPNLGKLNQGEVVVWSTFARLPVKIVDEINRLPETKQSLILDGLERGKWEYLNQGLINDEFCLFATANYQDQGTNTWCHPCSIALMWSSSPNIQGEHCLPDWAVLLRKPLAASRQ